MRIITKFITNVLFKEKYQRSKSGKSLIAAIWANTLSPGRWGCTKENLTSMIPVSYTHLKTVTTKQDGITLMQFLDSLSSDEQRAALIHLSVRWAEQQGGVRDA